MMNRHHHMWMLAAAVGALVACNDRDPVAPPPVPLSTIVPAGAVQAVLQQEGQLADGSVTFVVRIVSKDVGVSAYQGEVTFDPGAVNVGDVTPASGRDDEAYVVNPQAKTGSIRFAAFTATTFAGTDSSNGVEAFRFTAKMSRSISDARLAVRLDVVGKETGVALEANRLVTSTVVRDVNGRMIK